MAETVGSPSADVWCSKTTTFATPQPTYSRYTKGQVLNASSNYQHRWCFNPEGLPIIETLSRFLRTWPDGVRLKMHFSSTRTEIRELKRRNCKTGKMELILQPPIWTGHADYNNRFETITWIRSIAHLDTDIMLESKAKDPSLIRLRNDLARCAPELLTRYGIAETQGAEEAGEGVETEEGLSGQDLGS